MEMYVDAEALNFRSRPEQIPSTRLGMLHLGQRIDLLDDAEEPGWARISAGIDGHLKEGFVSRQFLREPVPRRAKR